jgi:hypothetical protein
MKKLFTVLLILLTIHFYGYSQCNPFYNFSEINRLEQETFNAKGKSQGKTITTILDHSSTNTSYQARMKSALYSKNDKLEHEGEFEMSCENGVVHIDIKKFFPQESLQAYQDMDVIFEGTNLEIPGNLQVGESLKSAMVNVIVKNPSIGTVANMTLEIYNRKVSGTEKISTEAGSFDTYIIDSELKITSKMGVINMTRNYKSKDWVAMKVGTVKSESLDKNGKLQSYSILTKIN